MTKELIEEAWQEASIHDKLGDGFSEGSEERAFYYGHRDRYKRLADALEAALAACQPTEGEYILKVIESVRESRSSVEIRGVKIMPCDEFGRTAAVPDAATERVTENSVRHVKRLTTELQNRRESLNDQRREFRKLLAEARAERDAALEAIERVRAIHVPEVVAVHESHGAETWCAICQQHYPCDTSAALDGAPVPEALPVAGRNR